MKSSMKMDVRRTLESVTVCKHFSSILPQKPQLIESFFLSNLPDPTNVIKSVVHELEFTSGLSIVDSEASSLIYSYWSMKLTI